MKTIKRSIAALLAAILTLQFYNGVFLLPNNSAHADEQPQTETTTQTEIANPKLEINTE